jgi:hypothetical protein
MANQFTCADCGSADVEIKMWVNPNTDVIGVDCEEDAYCNECKDTVSLHVGVDYNEGNPLA